MQLSIDALFPGKIDLILVIKTKSANSTLANYFDEPIPNATFPRWPFPQQNCCDICHEDQQIWLYSPLKLALLSRLITMNQYQMQLCFLHSRRPRFTTLIFLLLTGFCSSKSSISPENVKGQVNFVFFQTTQTKFLLSNGACMTIAFQQNIHYYRFCSHCFQELLIIGIFLFAKATLSVSEKNDSICLEVQMNDPSFGGELSSPLIPQAT